MVTADFVLGEGEVAEFRENGAAALRGVFDADEVARLQEAIDHAMREPGPFAQDFSANGKGGFFADQFIWTRIKELGDLILTPRLGEIAGRLMGASQVRFFFDHLLVKEPGTTEPTPWHQDAPYFPISGFQCCSIWIALDSVTRESGAVEYAARTHASGKMYAPKSFHGDDRISNDEFEEMPDMEANRDRYDILTWDLNPGDCVVHDVRTIHGAPGNTSAGTRRRGLATRWIGEDIRFDLRDGIPRPMLDSLEDLAPELKVGDAMVGPVFPLVWQQS